MSETNQIKDSLLQQSYRTDAAKNVLDSVLTAAGFDADDLQIALEAIKQAKQQSSEKEENADEYKNILDKTLVYEDRDAFIYKRGDTKSGRWYLWIYDKDNNKRVQKSLLTTDKTQALASARLLYIEIKGKIERGERLKSLTTPELIELWDKRLREQITDVPHLGITPGAYKVKRRMLKNWLEYIDSLSLSKTPIDKIKPYATREFGSWVKNKPKQGYKGKPRSPELINGNISEVLRMYKQLALRDKYIGQESIPEIDRVKTQREQAHKRDILTEKEYEKLWKYIQFNYITKKHNPEFSEEQLEKRKIWKELIFIMSNVGFRSKELLGIRMNEITSNLNWDLKKREENVLMKVRSENSKTGKSRICVAPVKKRIDRILSSYKKLGINHEPNDYLFMNPNSKTRNHYTRDVMSYRLKEVLNQSGLNEELSQSNKNITLYSFRHQYATWRLRYGDVPIHLLAKQMGTSVRKIEETYGHIQVEMQADLITKSQEHIKRTGFILDKPEVFDENESPTDYAIRTAKEKGKSATIQKKKSNTTTKVNT